MNPRFTVLLPTHNRADVLGYAIQSVLDQTEVDLELLIVADGCTDHTAEVVSRFKDPRIRFFDLPKAPYFGYANRNIALKESKGRLIAFAAHDDLWFPDHLKLMDELLSTTKAPWGYSRPLWVSTDGIIVPFCTNLKIAEERAYFFEKANSLPAACVVHTREALEKAGYWPEEVPSAGDWVLWKRMIKNAEGHLAYLRTPTTLHFSANWKQCRHSMMPDVQTLLSLVDAVDWWPDILRHPPDAKPEQVQLWHALSSGGMPWVTSLRDAIDTVIDRIAWHSVKEMLPHYEILRKNYESVIVSKSWRYTKPVRQLTKWLRGISSYVEY
jgi:hypothetical protein